MIGAPGPGGPAAHSGGNVVVDLLVKVLINAVGVFAAIQVVPQIDFAFGNDWWKLLAVALILALVNSYVKPILKVLSFPITLISLGLFALVLNALLLLLVALVSDQLGLGFRIDKFPPSFTADAFIGALLGSIIISIVSTILGMVNAGRRVVV
jgi:putative membrane protein